MDEGQRVQEVLYARQRLKKDYLTNSLFPLMFYEIITLTFKEMFLTILIKFCSNKF